MGGGILGINEASFRELMQRLTAALEKPSMGARRWVDLGERARLVSSLEELVHLFGTTDLATKRALVGLVPSRRANQQTETIASSLRALCSAVERHFGEQISSEDRRQLKSLLEFPAPDYLSAIGVVNSENAHFDVLAYLFSFRIFFGMAFAALDRLAQLLPQPKKWNSMISEAIARDDLSVRREVRTGNFWALTGAKERIDLVISSRHFVIVIENKLWSPEHKNQTTGYWEWLSSLPGEKVAIFLSPAGFKAQSDQFISMSYLRLAWCFLGENPMRRPEEEVMLSGYFRSVFRNILGPHLNAIMGEAT